MHLTGSFLRRAEPLAHKARPLILAPVPSDSYSPLARARRLGCRTWSRAARLPADASILRPGVPPEPIEKESPPELRPQPPLRRLHPRRPSPYSALPSAGQDQLTDR